MKNKFKAIFLLGPPGSGKGTQCEILKKKFNLMHLSAGDLLRRASRNNTSTSDLINNYMKDGKIVPVKITCNLLKNEMELNKNKYDLFLIDGFPRNFENLNGWNEEMKNLTEIKMTIVLDCDKSSIIRRIKMRSELEGRIDDSLDTLEKRIISYEKDTKPVINELSKYSNVLWIDGCKEINTISRNLIKGVKLLL